MSDDTTEGFLKRLAKGIAGLFGENCEVAVHDLKHGYENTIIAIENGQVSGRKVGDGSSEMVLRALKENKENGANIQDEFNYLARTKTGRMIKSSSIYIRDKKGKPVYLFGINYDITDLMLARHALESAVATQEPRDKSSINTITNNVNDLLDQLILEADAYIGKPVVGMTKEDKTRAIQLLNDKGAFLVKKAGDKVSKHYDISKYTLYNYMGSED